MHPFRIFFNVGDGLFTFENSCGGSTVFDCGGESQKDIDDAINRLVRLNKTLGLLQNSGGKPVIDNLFISHYHDDHIIGLPKFLSDFKVRRIFLPFISPIQQVVTFVSSQNSAFSYSMFSQGPREFIRRLLDEADNGDRVNTSIFYVGAPVDESNNAGFEYNMNSGALQKETTLPHRFTMRNGQWEYRTYNIEIFTPEELYSFMKSLSLNCSDTFDDIIKKLAEKGKTLPEELKNIIASVLKSRIPGNVLDALNKYSLVLWSGCFASAPLKTGCLYTGDFDYKTKSRRKEFDDNLYRDIRVATSIVQIPHHGSPNNFDISLCNKASLHIVPSYVPPRWSRVNTVRDILANQYALAVTGLGDITVWQ